MTSQHSHPTPAISRRIAGWLIGLLAAATVVSGFGTLPAAAEPAAAQPVVDDTGDDGFGTTPSPEPTDSADPEPSTEPAPEPSDDAPVDPSPTVPAETPEPTETPAITPLAVPGAPEPAPADPNAFVCWGDSLSYHVCNPGDGGYLQSAFGSGKTVINRAVGGQNSSEIATRMGAYEITITFPGNVIPASGSVDVTVGNLPNKFGIFASSVWISGVEGRLVRERGYFGGWVFERYGSGAATPVSPNTPVHMLESNAVNHPGMIWVGRNNVSQPDQVIADVAAMVATHRATSDQPIWVIGMTPARSETTGTQEARWISRVNSTLKATYGQYYIPMDDYLRDIAMRDLGLAMTGADQQAVAKGVLPPSLMMDDGMHFNSNGRRAIANYVAAIVNDPANDYIRNFDPQGSQAFVTDYDSGVLQVVGWGFDKSNVFAQLDVSVSLNGAVVSRPKADWPSPYLAPFGVPGNHAFWTAIQLGNGSNEVCVTFHNIGAGNDLKLPCRTIEIEWKDDRQSPQGDVSFSLDSRNGRVNVVGWAFDHSHLFSHLDVRVTVNGADAGTMRASLPTDYLHAYGVPGGHGFVGGFSVPTGTSRVCVIALDIAPGRDTTIRCENFTLAPQNPEGRARVTMNNDGSISVLGHAFDRYDLNAPIDIAIFQNNQLTHIQSANAASPELYPYGVFAPHGISMRINPITTANSFDVCVLAINIGRGESQWFGCWHLDSRPISPQMAFSAGTNPDGRITVDGWAFDASVPLDQLPILITVDGVVHAQITADQRRSELNTLFGWPGDHGFVAYLSGFSPGAHQLCVTAYNTGATAPNTRQCQTVYV